MRSKLRTQKRRSGRFRSVVLTMILCLLGSLMMSAPVLAEQKQTDSGSYAVGPPEVLWAEAPDGAAIYIELYRPTTDTDGVEPTGPFPTILRMTPYEGSQSARYLAAQGSSLSWKVRDRFVPEGYAFALGHVYGTGNSEGCLEMFGDKEIAATSATIEFLATQPWSNGKVGMFGTSYDGGEALHVAALGSDAAREHLGAVVALDGTTSLYETFGADGVPAIGSATSLTASYAALGPPPAVLSPSDGSLPDPVASASRQVGACRADNLAAAADFERTGDFSAWLDERSARRGATQVKAATLMFEGFHDGAGVGAMGAVGYFDQIPKETPHKMIIGQWGHAQAGRYRTDQWSMIEAWFDRYLRDLPTGTEGWPNVQIQDSAGGWRAEDSWPTLGKEFGQLALTTEGGLGTSDPTGSTTYLEGAPFTPPGVATFSTGPLPGPLHLAGDPVIDLWVKLENPDAHIATQLRAFTADGTEITGAGQVDALVANGRFQVVGARSVQHLDPIAGGEFRQASSVPAPVGVPVRVPIRFLVPIDLVVPAGGWLTVDITGSNYQGSVPTLPSGSTGGVEILHDCEYPSMLRFDMLDMRKVEWLYPPMSTTNIQAELQAVEVADGPRDAAGLASERVCGQKPLNPAEVLAGP